MNQILIYFFMAIALSMDAFSLAIAYGTTDIGPAIPNPPPAKTPDNPRAACTRRYRHPRG